MSSEDKCESVVIVVSGDVELTFKGTDKWRVENGTLKVCGDNSFPVAQFAEGEWSSVRCLQFVDAPDDAPRQCRPSEHDFEIFIIESGSKQETTQEIEGGAGDFENKTNRAVTKSFSEPIATLYCTKCGETRDVTPAGRRKATSTELIEHANN